jgi:hypothetical protein
MSTRPVSLLALAAATLLLCFAAPTARAKLGSQEWKAVQGEFERLFGSPGNAEDKVALLKRIADDGTGRAWRLLSDALFREVELHSGLEKQISEASDEHAQVLERRFQKGGTPEDEARCKELQAQLEQLEKEVASERKALDAVVGAVSQGPEVVRRNILQRARTGGDWPYRAAAARVAAHTIGERPSWDYLQKAIAKDEDPRVRLAALDALADAKTRWEELVIGRLADPEWTVVLRAAQIAAARGLHKAVPHLINALGHASPRLAEGIGKALRTLTKENFEPYVDVWTKWWRDHKDDFEKDVALKKAKQPEFAHVHFYGVEIKSNRVLFIIDISSSMKLPTKNKNPRALWKPPPVVTGPHKAPPPPPPPEEILSGPKIKVAKHELGKAIKKLPKAYTFNMICFNQGAMAWQKKMVKATEQNKASALKWVGALTPHGTTYVDGALRLGFKIAGLLNYDKRYPDIAVDTIWLISDGAPTDNSFPTSKLMDPEVILEHVRHWNKRKQVVINCIGVDMVQGIEFLQKLAAENGGVYIDR